MTAAGGGGGHKHHKPVQQFSSKNDFALDAKIRVACFDLKPSMQGLLLDLPTDEDRELIADYILQWANQIGQGRMMARPTKRSYVTTLVYLSRYLHHAKSFRKMTKEDILDGYLSSLRKDFASDPDERWVNTYNTRATKILAFSFKIGGSDFYSSSVSCSRHHRHIILGSKLWASINLWRCCFYCC
jgi:hypothetical protein